MFTNTKIRYSHRKTELLFLQISMSVWKEQHCALMEQDVLTILMVMNVNVPTRGWVTTVK